MNRLKFNSVMAFIMKIKFKFYLNLNLRIQLDYLNKLNFNYTKILLDLYRNLFALTLEV